MSPPRGLTLVEVLAATVLMAILAATCVPVLQRAARAMEVTGPAFELHELSRLADAFVADPAAFGQASAPLEGEIELAWPDDPDRPPIRVGPAGAGDAGRESRWLLFTSGGWSVARWLPGENEAEEGTP